MKELDLWRSIIGMKRSPSQYRLITGIKSQNANPIMLNRSHPEMIQSAHPTSVEVAFRAEDFDKEYAINYTQHRWFQKQLSNGEQVLMTADQFKMICAEVHEMGMLREKNLSKIASDPRTVRLYSARR